MPQSHLVIQHLLRQLEDFAETHRHRDRRPKWLVRLAEEVGRLFEPFTTVARVGYECEPTADGWELRMYLGSHEFVDGGRAGGARSSSFDFDVTGLVKLFDQLDDIAWTVAAVENNLSRSFLTASGIVQGHPLQIKVYSISPREMTPGLRMYDHGGIELVDPAGINSSPE